MLEPIASRLWEVRTGPQPWRWAMWPWWEGMAFACVVVALVWALLRC